MAFWKIERIKLVSYVRFAGLLGSTFLAIVWPGRSDASIVAARSASLTDVTSAVNLAANGDTVTIPAGTAMWTSMLTVTKNISIQGAGSSSTIITDNLTRTTGVDNLIKFSVSKDLPFGLRGVKITQGSETTASSPGIMAIFGGTSGTTSPPIPGISTQLRITDVNFNYTDASAVAIRVTNAIGVIDNCTFNVANQFLTIFMPSWMGGDNGHGSWADDPTWGTSRFLYVEDCTVNVSGTVRRSSDGDEGTRYVVRYCTMTNSSVASHGTEASGRGTKQIEIYNNTFNNVGAATQFPQSRSGSVLMHDNILSGYSSGMSFQDYRFTDIKQYWGGVSGVNGYDVNATDGPLGGSLYASGTHTGGNNSTVLIDSTKSWSSAQWATDGFAYVIDNTSRNINPSFMTSVTASHQINFSPQGVSAPLLPGLFFNTGDHYEIRKVLKALDQPGQGKGSLKSGTNYLPDVPPNTVTEPCYSWNNWTSATHTTQLDFNNLIPTVKLGRDYFDRTAKPGYIPYTYPHPLTVDGGQTRPGAPSNLDIIPGQ